MRPLGMISNPAISPATIRSRNWLEQLVNRGVEVVISEIADYEVRRELLRVKKTSGLARLNGLKAMLTYQPLTTQVMLKAAENWAIARQRGRPSAGDEALDADVILAAQSWDLALDGEDVVIATTNIRHLELFASAKLWEEIR